jgi:hypothetical protein
MRLKERLNTLERTLLKEYTQMIRIIAPLLAPDFEAAEKRALREHILRTESKEIL